MKPEEEKNIILEGDELTEADIAAIRRSEEEIERGEYLELDDAIKLFRKLHPESDL